MALSESYEPRVFGPSRGHFLEGQRLSRTQRAFGIYDDNGFSLPGTDIRSEDIMSVPEGMPALPSSSETIDTPSFFGGVARNQFGHVILNCLGRLWGLEHLPSETNVVFWNTSKRPRAQFPLIEPFVRLLGFENDIKIRSKPAVYTQIHTCSNTYGEALGGLGTPGFHRWIDQRLPAKKPVDPELKVYLTRSQLGPNAGRYACEDHLESLLEREGYRVVAPEKLSLQEQVELFQTAGKLIFAEGSALHLFAMVKREHQQAVVIQRRDGLPRMMLLQMNDRRGLPVEPISVLRNIYWPPKRSDHLSVSFLDFEALKAALITHGMISANTFWSLPDPEAERLSLNAGLDLGQEMLDRNARRKWLRQFRRRRRNKAAA
ncbi:MAG: glycosyltransferase family 61 protein [Cognatishimia sp.]|uniref:glycosyltransferase 61 family protein n=1 Tax=Cognatishimia sp. TaxID=2211648 RepID=UPI003B8DC4ED